MDTKKIVSKENGTAVFDLGNVASEDLEKFVKNWLLSPTMDFEEGFAGHVAERVYSAKRLACKVTEVAGVKAWMVLVMDKRNHTSLYVTFVTPYAFYSAQGVILYESHKDEFLGTEALWKAARAEFVIPPGIDPDAKAVFAAVQRIEEERKEVIWSNKLRELVRE